MSEQDGIGRRAEDRSGGGRLQASGHGRVATLAASEVSRSRSGVAVQVSRRRVADDGAPVAVGRRVVPARRRPGGVSGWHGRRPGSRGPRPVRPVAVPVVVRPAARPRPTWPAARALSSGPRPLARRMRTGGGGWPLRIRIRRALATVGLTVVAAAVVVGLGQLGGVAAQSRDGVQGGAPRAGVTTVATGSDATAREVARGVAPAASDGAPAASTEQIVTDSSLTSVQRHPGQVLPVPVG